MFILGSLENFLLVIIELFSIDVTAEALRAKIDRKWAVSLQRGQYSGRRGRSPPIIFAWIVTPINAITLPLTVFTQKNFVADKRSVILERNSRFAFMSPLWGT